MAFCTPIHAILVIDIEPATLKGEQAQRQGIISALSHFQTNPLSFLPKEDVLMENNATLSPQQIERIQHQIARQDGPFLILTGGNQAFDVLESLNLTPEQKEKALIVLTAHQLWDPWSRALSDNPHAADIIALPTGPVFVRTPGVCHDKSPEIIKDAYEKYPWSDEVKEHQKYLLLILPGDLQNAQGEWVPFTSENAVPLISLVQEKMHEMGERTLLLVTNGPRTGRGGTYHDKGAPLDPVTQSVTKALDAAGIPFILYDFRRGEESSLSPLLSLIAQTKGSVLVAGESISMGSEIIDSLPGCSVTLYEPSHLLSIHKAYIASENKAGRASLATYDFTKESWTILPPSTESTQRVEPAASAVAQAIIKALESK